MSLIRNLPSAIALAACVAIATPAAAGVTEFFDGSMTPSQYDIDAYADYDVNIRFRLGYAARTGPGGVAGTAIHTAYGVTGISSPAPRFNIVNPAFVYDPSIEGEILSIDASFDQSMRLYHNDVAVSLATGPALVRLIAEQDGNIYLSSQTIFTGLPFNDWIHISTTGLVASDFRLFDPANPFAPLTTTGLDFGGGAITFGLQLAHFGVSVGGGPSTGLVDSAVAVANLRIAVHSADSAGVVPEPGTWALMIGGFGLAGTALRRRRASVGAWS
ncbi:PEPxxWA-CTERM sorting domain-containing protein [Phenylobacterium sp.]|uniref:PEPxxWA-CTERM sorting domain-containing protein n=1 Tax=Phenylobacterium sp. TaxID=1871053 RepID=UPI00301CF3BE